MHPHLVSVAARRHGVFTAADAVQAGYRPDEIRAELAAGRWRRLRRGVYVRTRDLEATAGDVRARHVLDCLAVPMGPRRRPGSGASRSPLEGVRRSGAWRTSRTDR